MITHRPSFPHRPDGLSPDQLAILNEPLRVPAGYGMKVLSATERQRCLSSQSLGDAPAPMDKLLVWEPPRRSHLYVVAADISTGSGLDRSVIDVCRVGTTREPDEQVAQFVTDSIDETDLAYVIDSIGRLYSGRDKQPAMVAIECNGMGLATQNEMQRRIGYTNLYVWQYLDAIEGREFTTRYGWYTNQRTRPLILQRYLHAVKTVDPLTGYPDYRINSPHTLAEMADFQSPGPLWLAEAVDGAHDDCILAGAISVFVAQTLTYNQRESVHDTRRRLSLEQARAERVAALVDQKVSYQTTDFTEAEMSGEDVDLYGEPVHNPYEDEDEHFL